MSGSLFASFQTPDRRFAPVVFWAINHHLDPEEIRWQIREMAAQGLGGFFFHPREGMRTPYFSEKYWIAVAAAMDEAEKAGVDYWLYDEDPYPSGMAGGKVVWDNPDFVARRLIHGQTESDGDRTVYLRLGGDKFLGVFALSEEGGQTLDLTDQVGRARYDWWRMYRRAGYYPGMPTPPDFHWRSFARDSAWTLDWEAPPGRWKIVWFAELYEFGDFPHGGYADLTNPDAVRCFMELTHDEYARRFGEKLGVVVPGIFTDEPKPYGMWGKDFLGKFEAARGYDLRPLLPHLILDLDDRTPQVRADYQRTLLDLWINAFWQPIYNWCEEKGIAFTGHASPEEDPLGEVSYLINLVPCLQRMQIPGTDLITTKRIGNRQNAIMNLSPRLVSSVAHQTGRERVLCECFGLTEWDVTLEEMRWMADWLMVQGINLINPHMFMYSIDAFRKYEAPPSEFYQASYWRHYHLLADYLTRRCQLVSGGEHVSHIALLRPHRSFLTLLPTRRKEAEALRDTFVEIHQWLTESNYEFDQLDESLLQEAEVGGGAIRLGSESYRVLIIPPITAVEQASIPLIERFVQSGGKAVYLGGSEVFIIDGPATPEAGDALPQGVTRLPEWSQDTMPSLQAVLEACAKRTVWVEAPQVYSQHRRKDDRDIFFLSNTEPTPVRTTVHVTEGAVLEQWDAETGEAVPIALNDGASFELALESHESAVFVTADEPANEHGGPRDKAPRRTATSDFGEEVLLTLSQWQATPHQDNVLTLDRWNVRLDNAGAGVAHEWFNDFGVHEFGPLVTPEPAEQHWPARFVGDQPADFDAWYATGFYVTEGVSDCRLVWETETIQSGKKSREGSHDLWVNGTKIEDIRRERVYDAFNLIADVQPFLHSNATNSVVVRVPIRKRNDGLLEPLRVFGKFRVNLDAMQLDGPITSLSCGSWTDQGLPHYPYDVAYQSAFTLDSLEAPILLDLGEVRDIAEVFVNGERVGVRAWRPFRFDLTRHVKTGENQLRVVVTGNSVNLIYGTRRASGLMQPVRIIAARS